ncbi:adenylyltransferase/cytidyltransferase family protein [Patescibacteria group bacterium]|nr:adenylyltransferase/cytidyltransferase family protein [Patescibacteria group bacterium]
MYNLKINKKIVSNYRELKKYACAHRELGHKIVCTIGSWDMLHIGHLRYLNRAKEQGDILIVGVDSDKGIKLYKDPLRPVIPEQERMEMLSYQDCIDYIVLIDDIDPKGQWKFGLIKKVPIDIFVSVVGESYTAAQKKEIKKHCGELITLPRQAETTSTSDIIQNVVKDHLLDAINKLKS